MARVVGVPPSGDQGDLFGDVEEALELLTSCVGFKLDDRWSTKECPGFAIGAPFDPAILWPRVMEKGADSTGGLGSGHLIWNAKSRTVNHGKLPPRNRKTLLALENTYVCGPSDAICNCVFLSA
jgi:hypothetical protein